MRRPLNLGPLNNLGPVDIGPLHVGRPSEADLFVVSHSGARAGAPMVLLHLLRWLERETRLDMSVVLLHGGHMEKDFDTFDARILGGEGSRMWMLQRGLANMHLNRAAAGLAAARLGPVMWANRNASLTFMNSVGSLPALQFLPEGTGGKIVLYVHEMEQSFDRTIGARVWDRLSPRVDHFIACADPVADLLVERKGVDPAQVSTHHGFIERPHTEPLRSVYLRRSLGIGPDSLVVGASGRPDWRKAPEVFVRLARTIVKQRPDLDVHFVWLGGPMAGSPGWKIIHDFEEAGLGGRFHLTDESSEPAEIMGLFDVYALTSREDPYPLSMIEAAALGVPVVSFENGGVVDLAAAGGDRPFAIVVPYLDVAAMATSTIGLLTDPVARQDLATRAQDHVLSTHLTEQGAPRLFHTLTEIQPTLRGKLRAPQLTTAG